MHHGRIDVALGIKVGRDPAAIDSADSFDGYVANPNRRRHHYRASRQAVVWREHGLHGIRIELRSRVAVAVQIEDEPQYELVPGRLIKKISIVTSRATPPCAAT